MAHPNDFTPGIPQGLPPHLKNSSPSLLALQMQQQQHQLPSSPQTQHSILSSASQAQQGSSSDLSTRKKKQKETQEKTALTANAPLPLTTFIRTIVSKNKIRYCDAGFNLDLSCKSRLDYVGVACFEVFSLPSLSYRHNESHHCDGVSF